MSVLKEELPVEFMGGEYEDTEAMKFCDVEVIAKSYEKWPGPQKNVFVWYVLANGKAVGFNENPGRGWSFPVVKVKRAV